MSFHAQTVLSVQPRRLFMILSPRALDYARSALRSLLRNALEPVHLHLITDSASDKELLLQETEKQFRETEKQLREIDQQWETSEAHQSDQHACSVYAKSDLDELEAASFARYPCLRLLRNGHPCWRKITDPVLLSEPQDEMILLDPDLCFPNRFSFEPTLREGLLLMWQRPSCLLPSEVVEVALREKIHLARHVDIGVAQWRAPVDLDWLEWLVGRLGGANLPQVMHVEAILWAAIAMRAGGGYLNPTYWHCWRRSQPKRMLLRAGVSGGNLLRHEPFSKIKCFHAGGQAKDWIVAAEQRGWLAGDRLLIQSGGVLPFVELTPNLYRWEQRVKGCLKRLGYYNVIQSA